MTYKSGITVKSSQQDAFMPISKNYNQNSSPTIKPLKFNRISRSPSPKLLDQED